MKLTVKFCETTVQKTNTAVNEVEKKIKDGTTKPTYDRLKEELDDNVKKAKYHMQKKKTRKLTNLRYGTNSKDEELNQNSKRSRSNDRKDTPIDPVKRTSNRHLQQKPSYASILKNSKTSTEKERTILKLPNHKQMHEKHNPNRNEKDNSSDVPNPKKVSIASLQVEGGNKLLSNLIEGIAEVTKQTNQLKEQLMVLMDQQ